MSGRSDRPAPAFARGSLALNDRDRSLALATPRTPFLRPLGVLDRIETLVSDTNTILRDIRNDVRELAAVQRDS
jgi:hypothetical protein